MPELYIGGIEGYVLHLKKKTFLCRNLFIYCEMSHGMPKLYIITDSLYYSYEDKKRCRKKRQIKFNLMINELQIST